jgi:hypothetical protein
MYRFFAGAAVLLASIPAAPAADLKGFPFTDESLRYTVNWPSGLSLGDVRLQAQRSGAAWRFTLTVNAGVPGFAVKDIYTSNATTDLCSASFERDTQHGSKHTRERETIDPVTKEVKRTTIDGGESTISAPACVKDALALLFFARRELGQGKVPSAQEFLFGGLYQMSMQYSGAQKIQVGEQLTDSDKVVCTIKGPASDFQFEAFYARDAARTPLVIRVPLTSGRFSMELVR